MSDTLLLRAAGRLHGTLRMPGDKSIAHRALIVGAMARGTSRIGNVPTGADVLTTRRALERLGVEVRDGRGTTLVSGKGFAGLDQRGGEPVEIDCANSGTTARLLLGLLAGRRGRYRLTGDASLSRRPMERVTGPLRLLGAGIRGGDTLPLEIDGCALRGASVETGVPSAQVKGALLLAALQAAGGSQIAEPLPTRDHTERLLAAAGAPISSPEPGVWHVVGGAPDLRPLDLDLPGDPSSAAYFVALASCRPGSSLAIENISLNSTRLEVYRLLRRMGAIIEWRETGGSIEPSGRLTVTGATLHGVRIGPREVVAAIDEIPLLAIVAAVARGTTEIRGAGELRLKESDRLAASVAMLRAFGAEVSERSDGLTIDGGRPLRGTVVDAGGDHRMAMCAAVAAGVAEGETRLGGHQAVAISYPRFFRDLAEVVR